MLGWLPSRLPLRPEVSPPRPICISLHSVRLEREWQLEELVVQVRSIAATDDGGEHDQELSNLAVPTLIAHGDRDEINPAYLALELYELLPKAELWIMPDVMHVAFISHWVKPEEFNCGGCNLATEQFPAVLGDFLDRN